MSHNSCYDPKSECPKCHCDIATAEHVRYIPPEREVILRRCQVCGHVRVELPLDAPECE